MESKKRPLAQKKHDLKAALRFLELLYDEIRIAQRLEDIQDPLILKKLKEHLTILKEEFLDDRKE